MVASVDTTRRVLEVVRKFVPPEKMPALLRELEEIPGNKSFRDTVALMSFEHRETTS